MDPLSDIDRRLVLIWCRLKFPHRDIARAFGISLRTVATIADAGLVFA